MPIVAPIDETEEQPVIPTIAELNPPVNPVFNDVDLAAPYGYNKDGTPAKKRGRKAGTTGELFDRLDSVTESTPSRKPMRSTGVPPPIAVDYRPVASLASGLWFGIPQLVFGKDWEPDENELREIPKLFHEYFKAKGIDSISPEWGLGLGLLAYTGNKISKPTVATKLDSMFAWIKTKLRFKRG